ncbi:hypothetical protein DER45DRAFT_584883 [Fusarium avenaceum]|nr:hypothetical protein DER45DRAFT_584883 [Fusarium avenaceum]
MLTSPFTVIIVGGGPVGLLTAYALHRAGIDFVVLEQQSDVFEDVGASLIVSPHNLRVFHQLGLWNHLEGIGYPLLHHSQGFDARKHRFKRSYTLSLLQENHGSSLVAFHRAELIKTLYDNLPEDVKSRYLLGKKLTSAVATSTGIDVICADGHSYSASMIIGADGAHSKTRSIMRSCALQSDPSLASVWDPEIPFTSTYKCLWASFRRPSEPGDSRNKGWIFLYEKLDQPSNQRCLYDKEAIRSFKDTFADWPLNEQFTVKDVLQDPDVIEGMTNLEEGVVGKVSWNGRIVLVGDAWHKFTPNSGLGFNNGIQDVVSLCNKLRALIYKEDKPDAAALETVFNDYQVERCEPLRADYLRSAQATRLSTWATRMDYLLGRLILDYITVSEPFLGKIPWKYPMNRSPQKTE